MSVVDAHRADLEACFATGVASHPGLSGDVRLHLGIDAGGHVTRSMLQGSEALAVALAGCVGATARAWSFPAGTEAALTVPIHFGAR